MDIARLSEIWFSWALAASWQMALLVVFIALAAFLLRRVPARFRYAFWTLILVKAFLPTSLGSSWSIGQWGIRPLWETACETSAAGIWRTAPESSSLASPRVSLPGLPDLARNGPSALSNPEPDTQSTESVPDLDKGEPENGSLPFAPVQTEGIPFQPLPSSAALERPAQSSPQLVPRQALFLAYLAGLAVFLCVVLFRYLHLVRALGGAVPVEEGPLRVALERLAQRLGAGQVPELFLSENAASPFLVGLFRTRIVLPMGLPDMLTPVELDNVLMHELLHWRRRDLVAGWIQMAVQALFWFHPFVWFANSRLRHEREAACDEAVLALESTTPESYGESLLKVLLASRGRSSAAPGFLGIFERSTKLQERLENIMSHTNPGSRFNWLAWAALASFAAVVLPMSAAQTPSQKEEPARLNEAQRIYADWTDSQFASFFDNRDYAAISASQRESFESKFIWNLKGPRNYGNKEYYTSINSLGAIRSTKAVKPLLEIACDRQQKDCRDRWMAVRALGLIGDESIVPDLIHLVYYPNSNTRFWAQISLVRLTGKNFGTDWQAWGKWWNEQKRQPAFSPEKVPWVSNPELMDQEKQRQSDQEFLAKAKTQLAQRSGEPSRQPAQPGAPPRIVKTSPAVGATEVDPAASEITVTFDQDMNTGGWSWTGGGEVYPKIPEGKRPFYRDSRTCVLPVALEAGRYYRVGINSGTQFSNFRSASGTPTETTAIYFSTRGASEEVRKRVAKPVIVSMNPPNGATNVDPNLKEIRVTFNVEMGGGFSWCGSGPNYPESPEGGRARWSEDKKTCFRPVQLKPNWDYRLGINAYSFKNFSSAWGVPVDPVSYTFTTGGGAGQPGEAPKPGETAQGGKSEQPVSLQALSSSEIPANCKILSYVHDTSGDKRSLGASGHASAFTRPPQHRFVEAVQIFAARYGTPEAPKEDFHLYILNQDRQVLADVPCPYSLIERADLRWYTLRTPPVEVPERFFIALAFNPHQTKGIYLGLDTDVSESHSFAGLPEEGYEPLKERQDWMIRAALSEQPSDPKTVKRLADWKPAAKATSAEGSMLVPAKVEASSDKQSYGGSGPAIEIDLESAILEVPGASRDITVLKGIRLYAGRYGSGYDTQNTFIKAAILDSAKKVRWQGRFPYGLFTYNSRWVDLILPQPVPVSKLLAEADSKIVVALDPEAHQTKGIYFHYQKNPPVSHSFAGTIERGWKPVPDREWNIQVILLPRGVPPAP